MGSKFSSPIGSLRSLEDQVQSMLGKSLSFKDVSVKTMLQSLSFKRVASDQGVEPKGLEESSSFVETERCMKLRNDNIHEKPVSNFAEHGGRQYQAALKLQKVYKSFRTRRQLADCAVVAEQRWWKLLDFAELKRSSISFFEIEKQETAISRWSRARTRAAKVGKGLSKDEKARKLALQHWLEAIDPRHRYGHNLQFYYATWLHCESQQPFFYWLDIGDGREVILEKCPRSKLQQQCIKYLGPAERDSFEVVIRNGKFVYKQSEQVLDTTGGPTDTKWIFVLSAFKTLYVGMKKKGTFQHSSFLAGGATLSAGRLVIENGVLKAIWPHSGHYLPTEENFQEFISFLQEHHVDLTNVKQSPCEDDEAFSIKSNIVHGNEPENEGSKHIETTNNENSTEANTDSKEQDCDATQNAIKSMSRWSRGLLSKIRGLEIPARDDVVNVSKTETSAAQGGREATDCGYESSDECLSEEEFLCTKTNLLGEDDEQEEDEKPIPKEKIMRRIDSHKEPKSYQLADQLSSKWSSGAGPRISCMRDYPSELQYRVLEKAHYFPRPRSSTPATLLRNQTSSFRMSSLAPDPKAREKSKSIGCFETEL
ncbi:Homogentisate prenyltransferase isoform 1 [Hibiscus syriacus]|uniref:Homogentisate prenyltransferase isoform 1 n=1 Tax=Hibiscus syriacus TaxID=106335 RepID=A0A6A2ZFA5_HIBSY|nr:IQ domain-containing protein IQM6-like [Hibiscus syriacus]KAE8690558.1 Homogentisate prenyltransferase isoform 1 [Hibiscus syriacus]